MIKSGATFDKSSISNTTIGVVATNAKLSKAQARKVAYMAHIGYARAIRPVHTLLDGDTVFCLSTGMVEVDVSIIGSIAAEVMAEAVVKSVTRCSGLFGKKAHSDLAMHH